MKRNQPPLMSSEVETPRATVDASIPIGQIPPMDRDTALSRLKAHETELRAMGVIGLSIFGSVARGDSGQIPTWTWRRGSIPPPGSAWSSTG